MKEYRVVCDIVETYKGKSEKKTARYPIINGRAYRNSTRDKRAAKETLKYVITEAKEYEEKRQRLNYEGDLKQYNFRIQSREITEWEDE